MRDYKPRPKPKRNYIGNTLLGIFVGLLLGLLIASAIAVYMMKAPLPWTSKARLLDKSATTEPKSAVGKVPVEADRTGAETARSAPEDKIARGGEKADKPRFDFYRILPSQDSGTSTPPRTTSPDVERPEASKPESTKADSGKAGVSKSESTKADASKVDTGKSQPARTDIAKTETMPPPSPSRETFLLQAGAFQNPAEADNVKAKLALLGLESNIETVDLPDRGTWYRVRLGPYRTLTEVNHIRSQLAQSGIDVSLVRNNPAP